MALGVGLLAGAGAVALALLLWHLRSPPAPQAWGGPGTTPHFREIVLGRCYAYTQVLRPELG